MENFWDFSVWGVINLVAILLISLLVANMLKRSVKFLRQSLVPTSVLGGILLLVISLIYLFITGENLFDAAFFGTNGTVMLEIITYHSLALGFIAITFRSGKRTFSKERRREIIDTGVTTVATYLLQAVFGLGATLLISSFIMKDLFPAAGILFPFGYGQGTGQALNWGSIYESDYGFIGGRSFGLTVAALGFLSASIGGVVHLNIMKRRGRLKVKSDDMELSGELDGGQIQEYDEIPMNGSIDKTTVQLAFVFVSYFVAYLIIFALGELIPGLKSILYGFNFLIGVLIATAVKNITEFFRKKQIIHRHYTNSFLMTRISGFFFDLMIVAGIAAIRLDVLKRYWVLILVLGFLCAVITYLYNYYVAKKLFPRYTDEQFIAMYGMLTGTANTGMVLLRELDASYETPVADNLVFQNFPAIVLGFPMMLLAALAPKDPVLTLVILAAFFLVINVLLFRRFLFKRWIKSDTVTDDTNK